MAQRLILNSTYRIDEYEDVPRTAMQQEENRKAVWTNYLNNLSANALAELYNEYLGKLNEQITGLETEGALHAAAARNLYLKFEAAIHSYFHKRPFSKLPDVLMLEAMRKTSVLLATPSIVDNQINPDYVQNHNHFQHTVDDMKRHRVTSTIAGAGMILGIICGVALTVLFSLYTFGIFGAAALTTSALITFGCMAAVETGVVAWSAYKAIGLFNQVNKAKGIGLEMDNLLGKMEYNRRSS